MKYFKLALFVIFFLNTSTKAEVSKLNKFNKNLFSELRNTEGNIVISPFSISAALQMAYLGSEAETKQEFENVLGIDKDELDHLKENYQDLNELDSKVELKIANSFFSDKQYKFLPSYREDLDNFFKVEPFAVDFKNKPETAREKINQWVEQKTEDLIKDLIPTGTLNNLTRGVLVNAIYFNGKWLNKFNKAATLKLEFHDFKKSATSTPFLRATFKANYMENDQFKALELPYEDSRFSMFMILPKDNTNETFSKLESSFDENLISDIIKELEMDDVEINIPKFKSEFQISLQDILSKLGLKNAFSEVNANFTRMSEEKGLHISDVIHKAYIEVEEEGTKAAEATSVMMVGRALVKAEPEHKTFKADHPFLYLIRDNKSGLVLFVGRLISLAS